MVVFLRAMRQPAEHWLECKIERKECTKKEKANLLFTRKETIL